MRQEPIGRMMIRFPFCTALVSGQDGGLCRAALYQNFNYIFYAANMILFILFIDFNYIFILNMIDLLSVLPFEPIENYDSGSIFYIFFIIFIIIFKIIPAFVPISWGFVRDFFYFNFLF